MFSSASFLMLRTKGTMNCININTERKSEKNNIIYNQNSQHVETPCASRKVNLEFINHLSISYQDLPKIVSP